MWPITARLPFLTRQVGLLDRIPGAYAHKLYVNQTLFEAPADFTLAFTTLITVTWKADTTLAKLARMSRFRLISWARMTSNCG